MCLIRAPKPPAPPKLPEPEPADRILDKTIEASRVRAFSAREATRLTTPLGLPQGGAPATRRLLGG